MLVAGRGAVASPGAREAIEALAERSRRAARDDRDGATACSPGCPFALGIVGGFASPLCVELVAQADLVVSFGAGLNHWTARHGEMFPPRRRVVQVDIDPLAPGRLHRCDLGVDGRRGGRRDARSATRSRPAAASREGARTAEIAALIAARRWRDEPFDDAGTAEHVDPARAHDRARRPAAAPSARS